MHQINFHILKLYNEVCIRIIDINRFCVILKIQTTLTGINNLISKSLGSTNKVNIAYAVIEGLRQQVPRSEWVTKKDNSKKSEKAPAKKSTKKEDK